MRPRGRAASSSIARARPAPTAGSTGIAAPWIAVSLMAGGRPEQARAIDWEQDVDLDGNPPSVAVPRGPIGGEARSVTPAASSPQPAVVLALTIHLPAIVLPCPLRGARGPQRGHDGSIGPVEPGPGPGAAQHGDFMPQDDQFCVVPGCGCREIHPRYATTRYSLIRPPARACLRTRYCTRSTGSGSGFSGAALCRKR